MDRRDAPAAVSTARVLIIDDHPLVRLGFTQLLGDEPDLEVCGHAEEAGTALELVGELDPDLLVVDIFLPGTSGLELLKQAHARWPDLPMLVCSMHDETLFAERALRAGARGYINKQQAAEELVVAVREVLEGRTYLSPRMAARLEVLETERGGGGAAMARLSDRELEVFGLIGQGRPTRDIARCLGLSPKTVETYRENIKEKLLLDSGAELTRRAVAWVLGQE
ncbi:MAG: response regulator [Thermoanaerobaculia bacterium]